MAARDVLLITSLLFITAITLFIISYTATQLTTKFLLSPAYNTSSSAVSAMQGVNNMTNRLDYAVFGVFMGLVLALMITSWYVAGNPIFTFIYMIVVMLAVVFATVLSNTWETASTTVFSGTLASFPITNFLLLHLPIVALVIGFLGLIVMFAKPATQGWGV